jgi:hypothetical protein
MHAPTAVLARCPATAPCVRPATVTAGPSARLAIVLTGPRALLAIALTSGHQRPILPCYSRRHPRPRRSTSTPAASPATPQHLVTHSHPTLALGGPRPPPPAHIVVSMRPCHDRCRPAYSQAWVTFIGYRPSALASLLSAIGHRPNEVTLFLVVEVLIK